MPRLNAGAGEELINHFGLTRFRVTGSGNLRLRFLSLDEVYEDVLAVLPMSAATDVESTRLANFTQQRAQLEIKTTEINEYFQISKIVIFTKPVATSYPE